MHHKPTKEELNAGMSKSLDDLKKIDTPTPPPTEPPVPPAPPSAPVVPPVATEPPVEPLVPPTEPPVDHPVVVPPTKEPVVEIDPDYEKKFKESSREAQRLMAHDREINKAYEEAAKISDVPDDEMVKLFPGWEDMSDNEKQFAKMTIISQKKFDLVSAATAKFKPTQEWEDKVTAFIGDPKTLIDHPELEGKTDEFQTFAMGEKLRGVDLETVVLSFNGYLIKNPVAPKKGKMFESGGSRAPAPPVPKSTKLSLAQGEALRESDFKEYKRQLKAHNIETGIPE